MRIVIIGDGKVGVTLTERLSKEGHDLVVIDQNKRVLQEAANQYDVLTVHGNGATMTAQREADVGRSDLMIAATSADEVNLLCCLLARKLGVPRTIARVRSPEYTEQLPFLKEALGLSMTINPEYTAAMEILNLLRFPAALKRDRFSRGRAEIIELKLSPDSFLCGRKLYELMQLTKIQVLICAVERGETVMIPSGDFQLSANDNIYVTGASRNLAALVQKMSIAERKIRSVILIGGSRIAFYLAMALKGECAVKILEIDEERCKELAASLPHARVVHADGTQPETLISEGLAEADAVVTLTDIDEVNIVLSMYATRFGVYKVITKINRIEYNDLALKMGVNSIVSPKSISCNEIVRYVRAMNNTSEGGVLTLHRIVNEKVEALEFSVPANAPYLEVPLKDLRIKQGILIACIHRKGKIIIPGGSDFLRSGDSVIVVAKSDELYSSLNEIFKQ